MNCAKTARLMMLAFTLVCLEARARVLAAEQSSPQLALTVNLDTSAVAVNEPLRGRYSIKNVGPTEVDGCVISGGIWSIQSSTGDKLSTMRIVDHTLCDEEFSLKPGDQQSWAMANVSFREAIAGQFWAELDVILARNDGSGLYKYPAFRYESARIPVAVVGPK